MCGEGWVQACRSVQDLVETQGGAILEPGGHSSWFHIGDEQMAAVVSKNTITTE